mmetsp:Transcript_10178/g.27166  ORF Transcript_10178/g.27166 Transcript_10178/m.27166 type:complete len:210 (-) Transcript_10178:121-750(-)
MNGSWKSSNVRKTSALPSRAGSGRRGGRGKWSRPGSSTKTGPTARRWTRSWPKSSRASARSWTGSTRRSRPRRAETSSSRCSPRRCSTSSSNRSWARTRSLRGCSRLTLLAPSRRCAPWGCLAETGATTSACRPSRTSSSWTPTSTPAGSSGATPTASGSSSTPRWRTGSSRDASATSSRSSTRCTRRTARLVSWRPTCATAQPRKSRP